MKAKGMMTALIAVASVVGVGITTYFCAKETPKAAEELKKAKDDYISAQKKETDGEEDANEEVTYEEMPILSQAKIVAPHYVKTIAAGLGTSLLIIGGHVVHVSITAGALAGAYAWQKRYLDLDRLIKQKAGDLHKEIKKEIAVEEAKKHGNLSMEELNKIKRKANSKIFAIWDDASGQLIFTTNPRIRATENLINRELARKGYCTLNKYLVSIGGVPTENGDKIGWSFDNEEQIETACLDDEGKNTGFGPWVDFFVSVGKFPSAGNEPVAYLTSNVPPRPFPKNKDTTDDSIFG